MFYAGNALFLEPEELTFIEEKSENGDRALAEKIEAELRDREPDYVRVMLKTYGGIVLYNAATRARIGTIGNPQEPPVHWVPALPRADFLFAETRLTPPPSHTMLPKVPSREDSTCKHRSVLESLLGFSLPWWGFS